MKFHNLPLEGAFLIELEKFEDERGFFSRLFCKREFESLNLDSKIVGEFAIENYKSFIEKDVNKIEPIYLEI